jgi:hypothetical protein
MTQTTLATAIEHMNEWATARAIDGPITQEELYGIQLAIEELKRFSSGEGK